MLFVLGILIASLFAISSFDKVGRAFADDGNLLPAIFCLETKTSLERAMGVRSGRLADALMELSVVYSRVPRWKDAIRAQQNAIDMRREVFGDNDSAVLLWTANMCGYMTHLKQYKEADELLSHTLVTAEKDENMTSSVGRAYLLGYIYKTMCDSYVDQARWDDAEYAASQIVTQDAVLLADESKYVSGGLGGAERLSEVYAKSKRFDEAEQAAREAIASKTKASVDDLALAVAHEALGKVLLAAGKEVPARRELNEALRLLTRKFGASDIKIAYYRSRYDTMLRDHNPYKE